MTQPVVRHRKLSDMDGVVVLLRATHLADSFPLAWPKDPFSWMSPET